MSIQADECWIGSKPNNRCHLENNPPSHKMKWFQIHSKLNAKLTKSKLRLKKNLSTYQDYFRILKAKSFE